MTTRTWVQVLKHGLNKGFRNPKKEAELAQLHFERKARKERLECMERIWKIHAKQEQEQRAWEEKNGWKRKIKAEHYDREESARERLVELERERYWHSHRMQEFQDKEDYWGMGFENRLEKPGEDDFTDKWDIMEEEDADFSYQIACVRDYLY